MAKHKSGIEWFRRLIDGDGSSMRPFFRKGAVFAFGNRYPLGIRDQKLSKDLEDLAKDPEHRRYFYAEQHKDEL